MQEPATYRADLHVHSCRSENPANPGIRALRSRESYSDPLDVYTTARARGMDFVTITDHNTLDGSLAIAHLPGTFLGCEFDTWFPGDGVKVHVVALGIDEATFATADRARASIYDLVACLRETGTTHFLAHPLFDMTGRLSPDHVEKLLLLFNALEGLNGARVDRCNGLLREIVAALTAEKLFAMAERQGIEPWGDHPWQKALTGGSDDHSGLFVAGAHTVAGGDGTPESFLRSVAAGDCRPSGTPGDARLLAHSIYTASFHRIREIVRLDEAVPRKRLAGWIRSGFGAGDDGLLDKAVHGVRKLAPGLYDEEDGRGQHWEELLEREVGTLLATSEGLLAVTVDELNRRLFEVSQRLADDVVSFHLQLLLAADRRLQLGEKLGSGFAVGMVHFLEIPYFIAWYIQTRDRASQLELRRHFLEQYMPPAKLAVFVDPVAEGSPQAPVVAALTAGAAERGVGLEIVSISTAPRGTADGVTNFQVLATRPARNGATRELTVPSGIELFNHLEQQECTAVHIATTGPSGVAGVIAAKLLHLPVTGLADVPPACLQAQGSSNGRRSFRRRPPRLPGLLLYKALDAVFVTSREAACLLAEHGVDPGRIRILGDGTQQPVSTAYLAEVFKGVRLPPPRKSERMAARPKPPAPRTPVAGQPA